MKGPTMSKTIKLNADAVAVVKAHKHVVTLAKCLAADDKARARVGEMLRKGDINTTAQAVDIANRCERAMDALGNIPLANGIKMAYGAALDTECINADTRKLLAKMREACADIRAAHAASKVEQPVEAVETEVLETV